MNMPTDEPDDAGILKPARYKHDICRGCVYLGQHREHDLYFCRGQHALLRPTVIARFGDLPDAYLSGIVFAERGNSIPLKEALRRARLGGMYHGEQRL